MNITLNVRIKHYINSKTTEFTLAFNSIKI